MSTAPAGALKLADFDLAAPTGEPLPLLPIDGCEPLRVSDTLTLAACKRGSGEVVLARLKAGTDGAPDTWRQSARIADIARAISGGLLA